VPPKEALARFVRHSGFAQFEKNVLFLHGEAAPITYTRRMWLVHKTGQMAVPVKRIVG
jgi:hypothetical protein